MTVFFCLMLGLGKLDGRYIDIPKLKLQTNKGISIYLNMSNIDIALPRYIDISQRGISIHLDAVIAIVCNQNVTTRGPCEGTINKVLSMVAVLSYLN